ncbi:ABC transporter permease [Rhodoferax sp.]|uniref:ABC transporter permease n=1 Tax=Rhodoferax sp. TaxID=50421 RepID=UPI00374CE115
MELASPSASAIPLATDEALDAPGWIRNRVLCSLVLVGIAVAFGLAFLTQAPNRLVSGVGIPLADLLSGWRWLVLLPAALLAAAVFLPPSRPLHWLVLLAAAASLFGWVWLAGDQAALAAATAESPLIRTSFGGGFWVLTVLCALAAADALQRLQLNALSRTLAGVVVVLPLLFLLLQGHLDALSLLKEYANRQDVFQSAWRRHLQIVLYTLIPTLLIGVPLGVAAFRRQRIAAPLFTLLNLIQTVPSIALFGLLMAPLAAVALWWPGSGISGIGLTPAVLALTLYSLLPIVHSTVTGLRQVPDAVVESATGMGLTPRQIFWRVEVPLALPLLVAGIRTTTVQAVGLAVVAALIGAGGFGAIMFQGLLSSALDLVLLGVLPVVALAVAIDALFQSLSVFLRTTP